MFFITNVRYNKVLENGLCKAVTEQYAVDALSFTEAEARTIEEMRPYISGDFKVTAVKTAKFAEVIDADTTQNDSYSQCPDKWFKIRINFITLNETTGEDKKTKTEFLVQAAGLRESIARFNDFMVTTLADYEFVSVSDTPIMDVFMYNNQQ